MRVATGSTHFKERTQSGGLTGAFSLWSGGSFNFRRGGRWAPGDASALRALGPVFCAPVLLPLSVVLLFHSLNPAQDDKTSEVCWID